MLTNIIFEKAKIAKMLNLKFCFIKDNMAIVDNILYIKVAEQYLEKWKITYQR